MTQAAGAQEIIADVLCQKCGYNLRGLRTEGRCPECGEEARLSLVAPPCLAAAYGPWIRDLRRGAACILIGYAILGSMPGIHWCLPDGFTPAISVPIVMTGLGFVAIGSEHFATPEPYATDRVSWARSSMRWSGWLLIVVPLVAMCGPGVLALVLCPATNQLTAVLYAGTLARRIPVVSFARLRIALVVLLVFGWIALPIAAVVPSGRTIISAMYVLTMLIPVVCMAVLLKRMPKAGRTDPSPLPQPRTCPPDEGTTP